MTANWSVLFDEVTAATRPEEVNEILQKLGDQPDLDLGAPIGDSGLFWHPVGGDASNLSAINLATKAGRSLTERLTNAQDALLELRARKTTGALPTSPRDAAESWFGRPKTAPDTGLFAWDYQRDKMDRKIHVAIHASGREESPTIDVLDSGVGLTAEEMPSTILSLRGGNKIKKLHLMGAFGQGGSSTLGFSDYVIYASRSAQNPTAVGFTVVRVVRLGDAYKEDCFAYLALKASSGEIRVPSVSIATGPITYYEGRVKHPVRWDHGTLCRHVAFKISDAIKPLQASPGNLYHFLHTSLFDPLLPFRVMDLREPGKEKDELVSGSRNRLMKYVQKQKMTEDEPQEEDVSQSELRHYRPMEFVTPHGELVPSIGIEYWVPLNYRKSKSHGGGRVLRTSSSELFLQRSFPIVGTLNGQNQGEIGAIFIRRLGLGLVSRHIVVHVDASRVPNHVRRELFVSTREGFKEGPVLESVQKVLAKMISEDSELHRIERELADIVVSKDNAKTEDDVKRQITSLLLDAGVKVSEPGPTLSPGEGPPGMVRKGAAAIFKTKEPLPTLAFPGVTRWDMVVPAEEMDISIGDYEVVLVETDADAEYDKQQRLAIRSEPPVLEVGSKAPLSGGRVRWRLRCTDAAVEGQQGTVVATITRPDGTQLSAIKPFVVTARQPETTKKAKGKVPPFEVLPVNPTNDDDRAVWGQLWPELVDTNDASQLASVAYRTLQVSGKTHVYFNVLFPAFRQAENQYLQKSKGLAEMYRMQYKVWIGYHALLQESDSRDEKSETTDSTSIERTLAEETIRVATMQAKQAAQVVELRKRTLKNEDQEPTDW